MKTCIQLYNWVHYVGVLFIEALEKLNLSYICVCVFGCGGHLCLVQICILKHVLS